MRPCYAKGTIKTLATPDGRPNLFTFTTTFTTTEEYLNPFLRDAAR